MTNENDHERQLQTLGHQIGSVAGVLLMLAVSSGAPITTGQQTAILSLIPVTWALLATVYALRHNAHTRHTTPPTQGVPQP